MPPCVRITSPYLHKSRPIENNLKFSFITPAIKDSLLTDFFIDLKLHQYFIQYMNNISGNGSAQPARE